MTKNRNNSMDTQTVVHPNYGTLFQQSKRKERYKHWDEITKASCRVTEVKRHSRSLERGHTATVPQVTLSKRQSCTGYRGLGTEGGPDHKKDGTRSTFGETEYPGMQTSGSRSGSRSTWTSSRITQALSWNWKTAGFSCLKYRSPGNTKLDSLFQPLVTTSYSKY